jgi:predicted O-methyltransferase YrrM
VASARLPVEGALGDYLDALARVPPHIAALHRRMEGDEWAMMMTHPDLGSLLTVLARATGGRRVLEIGTFVGTSAAWMAEGLAPDGHIDTLEADAERASRARDFFARSGLGDRVTVHVGPALDTLPGLDAGAYDLAYIDADKAGYGAYLEHCVRLVRPGGLIVADNVLARGRVAAPEEEQDARTAALAAFTRAALDHPLLDTSVLTVGDGVTLSAVRPPDAARPAAS